MDDPLHARLLLESSSVSLEINSTAAAALLQLPRLRLRRAQLAELAPLLNASAAEEKTSVLDAAYWRRFLGELKALV